MITGIYKYTECEEHIKNFYEQYKKRKRNEIGCILELFIVLGTLLHRIF